MAITIKERAASAVPTPAADKLTLFADAADGFPKFKDDTGALVSLVGPEGPPGAAGADGADGDMTNPMTTLGDLIVGGASGVPARLGIATNGWVLTLVSGVPAWAEPPGVSWTNFDITDGSDDTTLARTTGGTSVVQTWESAALESEAVWTLTLTGEFNSAALVANSGGALTWAGVPLMGNPMTTAGDIIIGGTAGAPTRLAAGSNGHVLALVSGSPAWAAQANPVESIIIACSDETTALTTGTAKVTFRMPYAFTLTAVRASVTTAPTGSVLTVDINEGGTTILSTKLTIDATEKTSTTAATPAVISDTALADDAEITIDVDTVGSSVAGAGLKVVLIGTRT
jgi:hypothetical protein